MYYILYTIYNKLYIIYYILYIIYYIYSYRAHGGPLGWGNALQTRRSRVWFSIVSLELFIDFIFPAAIWLWCQLRF